VHLQNSCIVFRIQERRNDPREQGCHFHGCGPGHRAGRILTHFIHDIFGNVIAETNGAGPAGTTRELIWLPETEIVPTMGSRAQIDRPLGVVSGIGGTSPQLWMVHVDHLNRPSRMTNATKAVVWNATWLPWGGVHAITGSAALDARLPGQWYQLETSLHYNWHRHYDPTLGRYTQPDPLGFVDGPGVYGYAGGSPHVFVDPTGRIVPIPPRPSSISSPPDASLCGDVIPSINNNPNLIVPANWKKWLTGSWLKKKQPAKKEPPKSEPPSEAQIKKFEDQLKNNGPDSLEKSRRSIEDRLREHEGKIGEAIKDGGHTSSMEWEVRNFRRELA
jgi:RHS repeat-associated protein